MATDAGRMQMEPTNLPDKHSDSDAIVSSRVHGKHHPINDEYLPKSVWQSGVVRSLADYIRQLREVDDESNKRPITSQSRQSTQPEQSRHVCTRNPHRTCNCDAGVCADDSATYRYARGPFLTTESSQRSTKVRTPEPNELGNFNCPIDNKLCSANVCSGWCKSSCTGAETDADRGNASTTINR